MKQLTRQEAIHLHLTSALEASQQRNYSVMNNHIDIVEILESTDDPGEYATYCMRKGIKPYTITLQLMETGMHSSKRNTQSEVALAVAVSDDYAVSIHNEGFNDLDNESIFRREGMGPLET